MAKKRQKKYISDESVVENGVEVSRRGNSRGPEHIWNEAQEESDSLVVAEIQAAAREKKARVGKRLDVLDRLKAEGEIDQRQYDAGRDFQKDFYNARLNGYPQPKYEMRSPSSGDNSNLFIEQAKRRVMDAVEYMGGQRSPMFSAAWELLGLNKSLRSIAGNNPVRHGEWKAYLIAALMRLSDYYYPQGRKRC